MYCINVLSFVSTQVHALYTNQAWLPVLQETNEESTGTLPSWTFHRSASGVQWYAQHWLWTLCYTLFMFLGIMLYVWNTHCDIPLLFSFLRDQNNSHICAVWQLQLSCNRHSLKCCSGSGPCGPPNSSGETYAVSGFTDCQKHVNSLKYIDNKKKKKKCDM